MGTKFPKFETNTLREIHGDTSCFNYELLISCLRKNHSEKHIFKNAYHVPRTKKTFWLQKGSVSRQRERTVSEFKEKRIGNEFTKIRIVANLD